MPDKYYVASMRLSCNLSDPKIFEEFDKRFPISLQRKWSVLFCSAADADAFAAKLNKMIFDECKTWMKKDFHPKPVAQGKTFKTSQWSIGQNGQHEGKEQVKVDIGGFDEPWTLTVDGKKATIYAHSEYHEFSGPI